VPGFLSTIDIPLDIGKAFRKGNRREGWKTMKKTYVKPEWRRSDLLSHVVAGASTPKPKPSDMRLKTGIERVGVAPNGLPLYNFRYLWSDAVYQGVMAQDVLKAFPEAVSTLPNGYMAVRYDMLGMEMKKVH
jgi:hypothetical protein